MEHGVARLTIDQFKDVKVYGGSETDPMTIRRRELTGLFTDNDFIDGLYLQFGVYEAKTTNIMAKLIHQHTLYGFDSFEGLPCDWDTGGKFVPWNRFHMDRLPSVEKNVRLIVGWYENTIPEFCEEINRYIAGSSTDIDSADLAFIDIDSDVYESAETILRGLNDYIVPGTIIRFDELCDWRHVGFSNTNIPRTLYTTWEQHEWKALNEWLDKYDREVEILHRDTYMAAAVRVTK